MPKNIKNDVLSHGDLRAKLRQFANDRDWNQFHSAKNLSMALSVEVGELVEIFQWITEEKSNNLSDNELERVSEELADIFLYLLRISDITNIDLIEAANLKLIKNAEKYPISKSFGTSKKYTDL